jgi:hypothetical protein
VHGYLMPLKEIFPVPTLHGQAPELFVKRRHPACRSKWKGQDEKCNRLKITRPRLTQCVIAWHGIACDTPCSG